MTDTKFNKQYFFSSPVWAGHFPEFLKQMQKNADRYLKLSSKEHKIKVKNRNDFIGVDIQDFGMSNHSGSFYLDNKSKPFIDFCGQQSVNFLEQSGFNLKDHKLYFTEMWVQEFSKKGGGHHDTHVHWNQHVSGFYFLKCSNKTSFPQFHDPRPGAEMTKLPLKNGNQITFGTSIVSFTSIKPGDMIIFPGYLPHQFVVDPGIEPFRFIHWNAQVIKI
jgi:hypothetical protein